MTLGKHLAQLNKAGARQHVALLQVFAQHGEKATCKEAVDFLGRLRQARDSEVASSASRLRSRARVLDLWKAECSRHAGFGALRSRLFQDGEAGLSGANTALLSRAYNQLRRMSFDKEAEEVWPLVVSRVSSGEMKEVRELLGIWSTAPAEYLGRLDKHLAEALASREAITGVLVGALGRAAERPQSQAVRRSVEELRKRIPDLSSEDLAMVVMQSSTRLGPWWASAPAWLQDLANGAKSELIARDGALGPGLLIGLLGSLRSLDDELWPYLRSSLRSRKDLNPPQLLEVARFIQGQEGGAKSEKQLLDQALALLRTALQNNGTPGLVALVANNLPALVHSGSTCQALLNAAVRLRQDLFPASLWRLFLGASDVRLVAKHPALQSRLQRIGEILEKHRLQKQVSLSDMLSMVEAMRRNGVPLPKLTAQMAERFAEVATAEAAPGGEESAAEGDEDGAEEASPSAAAPATDWAAEAQRLLIRFYAELRRQGLEAPALLDEAKALVAEGGPRCRIDALELARCAATLDAVDADDTRDLCEALLSLSLPRLDQRQLVDAVGVISVAADGDDDTAAVAPGTLVKRALAKEVSKRLLGGGTLSKVAQVRRGEDLAGLSALLRRLTDWPADLAPPKLLTRVSSLIVESLANVLRKEPQSAPTLLLESVRVCTAVGTGVGEKSREAFREGLLHVSLPPSRPSSSASSDEPVASPAPLASLGLAGAADLAFGYSTLHTGDTMPLDIAAPLWRLTGAELGRTSSFKTAASAAAAAAEAACAAGCAPQLWAFGLSARHFCSVSTVAALRMMPEAPVLEACLGHFERQPDRARFDFKEEKVVADVLSQLRESIPNLLAGGEPWEDQFAVPGTPYVADLAFPGHRVLLIVPRSAHRMGSENILLSHQGRLTEALLKALDWEVRWVWPKDGVIDSEALKALLPSEVSEQGAA